MDHRRISISLWTALMAGVFSLCFTIPFMLGRSTLPIIGLSTEYDLTIASIVIVTSFIIPLLAIGTLYRRLEPAHERVNWMYGIVGRIGSAILGAFFFMFTVAIVLYLLDGVFPEAPVPIAGAIVLILILNSALGFFVAYIAVYFNTRQLIVLFALTFIGALAIAASIAQDRTWWSNSLSFLGWDEQSNLFFDFGLILCGLLMVAVSGDIIRDLREASDKGFITEKNFRRVQIMILLSAIAIITAGLFPTRVTTISFIIHQGSAFVFFGILLFLMASIKYLLPMIYAPWFILYGRGLVLTAVIFVIAYQPFNIISFVVLELALFLIVALWAYVFAQQTDQIVTGSAFNFYPTPEFIRRLSYAIKIGLGAGACGGIATFLIVYDLDNLVVVSRDEVSFIAIALMLTFPIASIVTGVSYRRFKDNRRGTFARVIISMVMAFLSWFVALIVIFSLDQFFTGVTVTIFSTVLFFTILSFAMGFCISYIAVYFDEMQELMLIGVLFAVGLLFATTHAAEPLWWQNSISFLGHDNRAFLIFSITMILCGLLLIVVGNDVLKSLEEWQLQSSDAESNHLRILHWIFVILGLCTVGIGLFPTTVTRITNDLHNISSHGMLLMFILLMFGLNRLIPSYPRVFIISSYAIGVLTIANVMGFFAGVYNYVIMEFFLVIILGTWLYLFVRFSRQLTSNTDSLSARRIQQHASDA